MMKEKKILSSKNKNTDITKIINEDIEDIIKDLIKYATKFSSSDEAILMLKANKSHHIKRIDKSKNDLEDNLTNYMFTKISTVVVTIWGVINTNLNTNFLENLGIRDYISTAIIIIFIVLIIIILFKLIEVIFKNKYIEDINESNNIIRLIDMSIEYIENNDFNKIKSLYNNKEINFIHNYISIIYNIV